MYFAVKNVLRSTVNNIVGAKEKIFLTTHSLVLCMKLYCACVCVYNSLSEKLPS